MAHFAKIENNKVVQVLVIDDSQEHRGQDFLANDLGLGGTWVQTSYNNKIRVKFAGIGDTYNAELDRFEPAQPHPSMVWNEETYSWIPSTPSPGPNYTFNTSFGEWQLEQILAE